eukprot:1157472-Pelagomonas_calceolata.AAC.5
MSQKLGVVHVYPHMVDVIALVYQLMSWHFYTLLQCWSLYRVYGYRSSTAIPYKGVSRRFVLCTHLQCVVHWVGWTAECPEQRRQGQSAGLRAPRGGWQCPKSVVTPAGLCVFV